MSSAVVVVLSHYLGVLEKSHRRRADNKTTFAQKHKYLVQDTMATSEAFSKCINTEADTKILGQLL